MIHPPGILASFAERHISQEMRIKCITCEKDDLYDVGRIYVPIPDEEPAPGQICYAHYFSNYFHCRECGGCGPWIVADYNMYLPALQRSVNERSYGRVAMGYMELFDGTRYQSPAMGEFYLWQKLEHEPSSAFLHARMGNVFREAGMGRRAAEWYNKALALDPSDLEATYYLFLNAMDRNDFPVALAHTRVLIRALRTGQKSELEDSSELWSVGLLQRLRSASPDFRDYLRGAPLTGTARPEDTGIRLLVDPESVAADTATENEAVSETQPIATSEAIPAEAKPLPDTSQFVPSLASLVLTNGLDPARLMLPLLVDGKGGIKLADRHIVTVGADKRRAGWNVPSLRELFRGDKAPPPIVDEPPPEYAPWFVFIESHLLVLCDQIGDQTDQHFEEVFSALRRRPDSRSLGQTHDFLWQVFAVLLGTRPISAAEYDAVLTSLIRSVRTWAERPISRNYVAMLRELFEEIE